jgi:sugar fermentation stimulation protein A
MRFSSNLTEATLLKRSIKFLAEIVLNNGQKLMIRCPNLNPMIGCDILGTKLWYSTAVGYHCLPTWEIVEVDGGHLVGINPEIIKPLVIEGIKKGIIEEFSSYNVLHAGNTYEPNSQNWVLLEKENEKCYVCLEHVTLGNDHGEGFFPEIYGMGIKSINNLIKIHQDGRKAILFFCVMHTGVKNIKAAYHIDPNYEEALQKAVDAGVKLLAYKASITMQGVEFTTKIPILFSKDAAFREH